jgi:hypothetical protein
MTFKINNNETEYSNDRNWSLKIVHRIPANKTDNNVDCVIASLKEINVDPKYVQKISISNDLYNQERVLVRFSEDISAFTAEDLEETLSKAVELLDANNKDIVLMDSDARKLAVPELQEAIKNQNSLRAQLI